MIYHQPLPFPYDVISYSPQGEIASIGAPMETILQAARIWAIEQGYQDRGNVIEGIAPL